MRGLLSFIILWSLKKRPMYGQEIADELARRRGEKPNPGTLYPALKQLQERELIVYKVHGRRKIYSLTEKGQKGIEEACRYFCQVFGDILEEIKE